jgi:hypothetical protein
MARGWVIAVSQLVKLGRGQHPRSTGGGNVVVGHRFARLRLTSFVGGRPSPSAAVLRPGSFVSVDQVKITLDRDRHDDGSVVEKPKVGVRCLKRSAQFPFRFGLRRRIDGDRREERGLECELGWRFSSSVPRPCFRPLRTLNKYQE